MPVLKHDEFINRINAFIGENPDPDGLAFLADMSDTLTDSETRYATLANDYRARFMSGDPNNNNGNGNAGHDPDDDDRAETITINDLFIEKGN